MRHPTLVILFFLFSCNSTQNKPKELVPTAVNNQVKDSRLDTLPNGQQLLDNLDSGMHFYYKEVVGSDTLKGGYITCYGIDDSMKYFYLRHGDTLHLLNKTEKLISTWSLGTLEKDFPDFFITTINNGNGVPETYQVFDKKTAENILGDKVEAWNYKYFDDVLYFLYDNHTVNLIDNYHIDRKEADSIFLYDMRSGRRQGFKLPNKHPTDIIYYDLKKITKTGLTISVTDQYSGKETLVKYSH